MRDEFRAFGFGFLYWGLYAFFGYLICSAVVDERRLTAEPHYNFERWADGFALLVFYFVLSVAGVCFYLFTGPQAGWVDVLHHAVFFASLMLYFDSAVRCEKLFQKVAVYENF
ncbi:hypothetical protein COU17_02475 [Candidatus Kaiserbacteria bacterium CG10_big_fil_rev_8_21_14_0_10_49_17]|uniref:Uncharacterized protein n=1 Tax=Candidatus Kaiserbacteria bacterium CG10_big_fil_rev_8_21_14_0_10_49_17 TaxID=1974609 RepID=A0A2M6WDZ0_9BACT|nr:MAG: hypothetical protein COU17_02475 [Candidatus Kaiserbacteria bacterium CG10_big_fil_rev_8_21_14_0_10_49_17]